MKQNCEDVERLERVLAKRNFSTVFQQIVSMNTRKTVGYEALTRFHEMPYRPPNEWLEDARMANLHSEFCRALLKSALQQIELLASDAYLALNVNAIDLLDGSVTESLCGSPIHRIVLEISENEPVSDYKKLNEVLLPLREAGLRLAVDDFGAGYANFWHVFNLNPDIIKLDVRLVRSINSDIQKNIIVESIVNFTRNVPCQLIAEGVETAEEFATLHELGVDNAQGYFISEPKLYQDFGLHRYPTYFGAVDVQDMSEYLPKQL